ncbi:MAG: SH3 domain-containing protein [Chloroflexi bacterium]|nr:SH3 domain-containing protein [Chloroflexota bacterium]
MRKRSIQIAGAGLLILMTGFACNLPGNGVEDNASVVELSVEEIQTEAVETVIAELTLTAASQEGDDLTEEPASEVSNPTATVSKDTNCRGGPNTIYNVIKVVTVGEELEVVGQYPDGPYVIVDLGNGKQCWLWLEYASLTGDISGLLAFSAPAPPVVVITSTSAPSSPLALSHYGYNECGNKVYMVVVAVQNNSSEAFQSVYVKLIHLQSGGGTHSMFTETNNAPFLSNPNQCPSGDWNYMAPGASQLSPGETAYLSLLANQRSSAYGENVQATIKVCTQDDLKGQCYEMVIVIGLPAEWGQ